MKALDSNVVLRLLLGDDPVQAPIAEQIVRGPCWISLTVLLEIAWVLGSRYRLDRADVAAVLRAMFCYETLTIEAGEDALWAIDRYEQGGDIADLLHLVAARHTDAFATFDRGIARATGPGGPVPIETLG
ncbi:type II toxin-antitoxin system VapC family toxin [Sphingomonas sp. 37zxx]|uniref:type II toxin-antitoxin system VapC family toxin n=1 Tax=Sphingomonas sp. 37zxx TaxID=1550073 RepID=UPI00053BF262|nr:type II toxin-antitoxin system VapC family toxin [Sphingomonas sp. 37zxx]